MLRQTLSASRQSFRGCPGFETRLILRPVGRSDRLAKRIALRNIPLGGLDRLDATPPLPALGFDLAHFFTRMIPAAVVAEEFRRGHGRMRYRMVAGGGREWSWDEKRPGSFRAAILSRLPACRCWREPSCTEEHFMPLIPDRILAADPRYVNSMMTGIGSRTSRRIWLRPRRSEATGSISAAVAKVELSLPAINGR